MAKNSNWVIGGGKGIGQAISKKLLTNNEIVFTTSRNKPASGYDGPNFFVGDAECHDTMIKHLERIKESTDQVKSVFICCHRTMPVCNGLADWNDYIHQFEGSVRPLVNLLKLVQENPGRFLKSSIVVMSTYSMVDSSADMIPRIVSKGALEALVKSSYKQLCTYGIRINALAVGWTNTPQLKKFVKLGGELPSDIPIGRMAEASEIADTAIFLASPQASYITGTVFPVSGGLNTDLR